MTDTTAMDIGSRIREARERYHITQAALAKKVGVSRISVTQWESGSTKGLKPRNLLAAARVLGVDVNWLVYGNGPMRRPATYAITRVPVVSWDDAGRFDDVVREGECAEYVDAAFDPTDQLFAAVMPDNSMEPTIPKGATLVVDAGMESEHLDYVIAIHELSGDVSCRQLVRDGGRRYLKAENHAYPMHPADDYRIIGVVREVMRRFR